MLWNRATRQFGLCVALVMALLAVLPCSPAIANETVWACGSSYGTGVFGSSAPPDMSAHANCPALPQPGGGLVLQNAFANVAKGQVARWQATAPSGLVIVGAGVTSLFVGGVNDGEGYGEGFYWSGGGAEATDSETAALLGNFSSSYFGFQLICGVSQCKSNLNPSIQVGEIALSVRETVGPAITAPEGLWQTSGWVRAQWPVDYDADSPSGVCALAASLNGQAIPGSLSGQSVSAWHQCAAPGIAKTIDVDQYGQGALPLSLSASDAAGNTASVTKTVYVDSTTPTLTLSGPMKAPSTAGTQYIVATAGGSPSGIARASPAQSTAIRRSGLPGVRLRFRLAESARTRSTARPPTTPSTGPASTAVVHLSDLDTADRRSHDQRDRLLEDRRCTAVPEGTAASRDPSALGDRAPQPPQHQDQGGGAQPSGKGDPLPSAH
jgi:hypothetical protein